MQSYVRLIENVEQHQSQVSEERIAKLYPKLRKYCQFLTQNSWDGEDLVQESLLKAWSHYQSLPEVSNALVNKMAYNHWIDMVRKRKKETLLSELDSDQMTDDTQTAAIRFDIVTKLLSELTPKQAVVLTLKEAFLFQNNEIAEILNTSETSIKSILHRAKQRMKNEESTHVLPYWENHEQKQLEVLLHESLLSQDPTILIQSIPFIRSLQKESKIPTCSMRKSQRSLSPSSIVYMAA